MTEEKNKPGFEKNITKKEIKKALLDKLAVTLAEYKSSFSEKQFNNRVNKAANFFVDDIAKSLRKEKAAQKPLKVIKPK